MIITLNNDQELKFNGRNKITEDDDITIVTNIQQNRIMDSIRNTIITVTTIPKNQIKFIVGD